MKEFLWERLSTIASVYQTSAEIYNKQISNEILRYTEYVYRVGLTVLAGGPHYVWFPTAYPVLSI